MRGAIVGAAIFAAYCLVILVTVAAGVAGYNYGAGVLAEFGVARTTENILAARIGGAFFGGLGGFVVSSFAAAAILLLRDIARSMAELVALRGQKSRAADEGPMRDARGPTWR